MRRWILFLPLSLLLSCSSYNRITYINSEPSYHESTYDSYGYNTVSSSDNYNIVSYDFNYSEVDSLKMEKSNDSLIETGEPVNVEMKQEVVNPVLNVKKDIVKIRANDFKEKTFKEKTFKEVKISKEKDKTPFQKNKKERNGNIIKWSLVIANLIVFMISPTFGLMTAPLTLCLVACLLYPKWIREGYLDTPYLKIAVFVAAFGGFIANLWWMILFLAL